MIHWTRWISQIFNRTLHPNANECTFFSSAHGTFSRIDHILGHKSGVNWYQKIGIVPCIFSDHNALKLELNHKKKFGRNSNMWRLKTILLKDERVNQEIREEWKRFMETKENEDTTIQNLWDTVKAVLKEKYITIQASLKKMEKKNQIHNLALHLKELEKEQQIKPTPSSRRVNKDSNRTQWNRDQKKCRTDQQNQELVLQKN